MQQAVNSMSQEGFVVYKGVCFSTGEAEKRAARHYEFMNIRRSLRHFSDKEVSKSVIRDVIMAAGTAPSGAHKQPWTFCAVSNPDIKKAIRIAAEKEEYKNYHGRMPDEWLEDLKAFNTDWNKPYLETAPWLIVVFKHTFSAAGKKNYYVMESVGIATGFLLQAIHHAGLVALTHTPSPMNFLADILKRPDNEKPYLLIPVGYPGENATVPDLKRKPESETICWVE